MVVRQHALKIAVPRSVMYRWPGEGHTCDREGWLYRACPSLKHYNRYPNSCHRRDCSKHWRDWLKEESSAAADRVRAAGRQRWQHVVISLGEGYELASNTESRRMELERVRMLLRFVGFTGGAVVAHSARAHTREEAHRGGSSGHFHALCSGWCDPERVIGLSEQYGYVIVAYGLDVRKPYARMVYMLSHAALPVALNPAQMEGSTALHAVTYWGILSYNKLKVPVVEGAYYCPGCGEWFPARSWHDLRLLAEPPEGEWGDLVGLPVKTFEPYGSWEVYQ